MTSVYDNSYLTVAASKGSDSSEGLFGQSVSREYFEFECSSGDRQGSILAFETSLHSEVIPDKYITLPNEALSERGWVLQERVLSRRTLLYTSQQICFECSEGLQGEDGLLLGREYMDVYEKPTKGTDSRRKHEAETNREHNISTGHEATLKAWRELLYSYGQRKLTHASDKLPAVSGLARIYAEQLGDEYVAGLWRSHLVKGLMWDGMDCRRVGEYKAPSWSWASIDGGFCYVNPEEDVELAEVVDVRVTLKGANPYGEVIDGRVQLRAPMEPLSIDTENWDPTKLAFSGKLYPTVCVAHHEVNARFDFDVADEDGKQEALKIVKSWEGADIFVLVLLRNQTKKGDFLYRGLIVRKVEGGEEYTRLGSVFLNEEILRRRVEEQMKDGLPIITLI
ncbi:related to tol protein [Fusarium torulosum]|uniref:Related to tol protein n=1 Tax=Fusarium torulosum TaxID=33205 RepID=A0AAE8M8X7_9HYPO|nr:related to tol protein [Fusarium torulosum]